MKNNNLSEIEERQYKTAMNLVYASAIGMLIIMAIVGGLMYLVKPYF